MAWNYQRELATVSISHDSSLKNGLNFQATWSYYNIPYKGLITARCCLIKNLGASMHSYVLNMLLIYCHMWGILNICCVHCTVQCYTWTKQTWKKPNLTNTERSNQKTNILCSLWTTLWKKPFCFIFPPENSRIKERKSRCWYQNNLPAAYRDFLNSPCQKSYGRKILAKNYRYSRKIPAFWSLEGDFLHSHAWKVKAGKSQQATTDTAGKSRGQ